MESAEFPIVNMLEPFRATDEFPLVFDSDPHWNEAGNAFVARIVAMELLKHIYGISSDREPDK